MLYVVWIVPTIPGLGYKIPDVNSGSEAGRGAIDRSLDVPVSSGPVAGVPQLVTGPWILSSIRQQQRFTARDTW